jgi:Zn-dependent peptidase ImmA (M78 family)/DNA-binding XRE family transcriptional regulator
MMSKQTIDTINRVELGKRLREAREKRGLNQTDAAKIIDASRTTMVAIEKGGRKLNAIELAKLASAYGRDASDFLLDQDHYGTADIQFRAPEELTAEEGFTDEVRQNFITLCQHYFELEKIMGVSPNYNFPRHYLTQHMSIHQAAEVIANKERIRLGLDDKPITHFRDLLENEVGLRVFFLPMNGKIAGMYFYTDALGGCIAINKQHPVERQRWSLAHEYAHFLIDRYQTDITIYEIRIGGYVIKSNSEKIADAFAKYFLLPQSSITMRFEELASETGGKLSPAGLCTIANDFGVSVEAMVLRLEGERLIATGKYQELKERGFKPTKVREKLGLLPVLERDDIVPLRLKRLAVEAFRTGQIDEGQLAYFLHLENDIFEARSVTIAMLGEAENLFEML